MNIIETKMICTMAVNDIFRLFKQQETKNIC